MTNDQAQRPMGKDVRGRRPATTAHWQSQWHTSDRHTEIGGVGPSVPFGKLRAGDRLTAGDRLRTGRRDDTPFDAAHGRRSTSPGLSVDRREILYYCTLFMVGCQEGIWARCRVRISRRGGQASCGIRSGKESGALAEPVAHGVIQSGAMTPQQFIAKWRDAKLSERSAYQQHFLDLCDVLGGAVCVFCNRVRALTDPAISCRLIRA